MAYLANTRVAADTASYTAQYGIYDWVNYTNTTSYYHFKTNINLNSYWMFMIEAIGYSYGGNYAIRCAWSGYAYPPSSAIIAQGIQNIYSGLQAIDIYLSSDNYAVLRCYGATYYSGWVFNSYTSNPAGVGGEVQITASAMTATGGNYY